MKKYILLLMSIILFTVSSCKKELDVSIEKTYVEEGVTGGSLGFGGIILTLMPDGNADFLNGGDIVTRTTYSISGNKVTLSVNNEKFKFKIISNTELRYDSRVLKLNAK